MTYPTQVRSFFPFSGESSVYRLLIMIEDGGHNNDGQSGANRKFLGFCRSCFDLKLKAFVQNVHNTVHNTVQQLS